MDQFAHWTKEHHMLEIRSFQFSLTKTPPSSKVYFDAKLHATALKDGAINSKRLALDITHDWFNSNWSDELDDLMSTFTESKSLVTCTFSWVCAIALFPGHLPIIPIPECCQGRAILTESLSLEADYHMLEIPVFGRCLSHWSSMFMCSYIDIISITSTADFMALLDVEFCAYITVQCFSL